MSDENGCTAVIQDIGELLLFGRRVDHDKDCIGLEDSEYRDDGFLAILEEYEYPIAILNAAVFQRMSEAIRMAVEFAIGQSAVAGHQNGFVREPSSRSFQ